jgi:hypothetical protein
VPPSASLKLNIGKPFASLWSRARPNSQDARRLRAAYLNSASEQPGVARPLQPGFSRNPAQEDSPHWLSASVGPSPTATLGLDELALDIEIQINHLSYDTLYLAFAVASGTSAIAAVDRPSLRSMQPRSGFVIHGHAVGYLADPRGRHP